MVSAVLERMAGTGVPMRPKVLVFAGSTRVQSVNRKLATAAAEAFQHEGLQATLADLRDYPMPLFDGDYEAEAGAPDAAVAFQRLVREHDALAIASPEFNGSFTALMKNVVDWASRPEGDGPPSEVFQGKVSVIMSASPGRGGGVRGLRHLRELLEMVGVRVLPTQLAIGQAEAAFDADGVLQREGDRAQLERLAKDLASAFE